MGPHFTYRDKTNVNTCLSSLESWGPLSQHALCLKLEQIDQVTKPSEGFAGEISIIRLRCLSRNMFTVMLSFLFNHHHSSLHLHMKPHGYMFSLGNVDSD